MIVLLDIDTDNRESFLNVLLHGMGLAGRQYKVLSGLLLEHLPHALDVVTSYFYEVRYATGVSSGETHHVPSHA
jgi:hypothetical protein